MSIRRHAVAVAGLGALGAATVWQLAARGVDVVGIDQFRPPHPYGSTHGKTRLFRRACLEHPDLYDWASRSAELFDALAAAAGQPLLQRTGGIVIGLPDSPAVAGTSNALRAHGAHVELLNAEALRHRYPHHADIRDDEVGVVDPDAGAAYPERFVSAALDAARDAGATVISGVRLTDIRSGRHGVRLQTPIGEVHADQVVIATGAWLAARFPELPLEPIRTPMTWFSTRNDARSHDLASLGVFVREIDEQTMLWGHGHLPGDLVKLGLADTRGRPRQRIDPDAFDRGVDRGESIDVSAAVARWFDGLEPQPARVDPCMITRTPDDQFVVGRWDERMLLAGGDSGHAFKHAPAIGEILAQCVLGHAVTLPHAFADPHRFDR